MLAAGAPSYGTPAAPPLVAKWASFQSSSRSSSGVMPMMAKTFRNVPFAMSRTACTGTATVRPSGWRITWWLPLTRTTSKPTRSSALTTCDPGDCRHPASHQATSSVSVSSGGGPTSARSAPKAALRSATAASSVAPSPTAPIPGANWADAHHTPSSSCETLYGTWTTLVMLHFRIRRPRLTGQSRGRSAHQLMGPLIGHTCERSRCRGGSCRVSERLLLFRQ